MIRNIKKISILILIFSTLLSCNEQGYAPKRFAHFRISLPAHSYEKCGKFNNCDFDISKYAIVTSCDDTWAGKSDEWHNIYYPNFNADIHISYKSIKPEEFYEISEETRDLAYKHTVRATSINESFFANDTNKVYGILYEMGGAAASQVQFFMTDSTSHILRGSLYFNNIPNPDSIAPVSIYIEQDIIRLVETLKWK